MNERWSCIIASIGFGMTFAGIALIFITLNMGVGAVLLSGAVTIIGAILFTNYL